MCEINFQSLQHLIPSKFSLYTWLSFPFSSIDCDAPYDQRSHELSCKYAPKKVDSFYADQEVQVKNSRLQLLNAGLMCLFITIKQFIVHILC